MLTTFERFGEPQSDFRLPEFAFYFFRTEMVIDAIITSFNFFNPCHSHVGVTYCALDYRCRPAENSFHFALVGIWRCWGTFQA